MKEPIPFLFEMSPFATSSEIACLTVLRFTPVISAREDSEGNRSPTLYRLLRIISSSQSLI